ncbi:MAG TPA: phage tail protein [Actinomycetota bacterium]|nr:phage tail protein [Actinomycetota bacterium]
MSRPDVHETTEVLYARLPDHYRDADARLDYPLLRYLSLIGDQVGELSDLIERFADGELADPDLADATWLPWLAQLVGARISGLSEAATRAAIAQASTGWRAGTRSAIETAAKSVLTGSQYVRVYDHSTSLEGRGDAGAFDVLVVTRTSQTPDGGASVIAAITDARAKPAGVVLWWDEFGATWTTIESEFPTWADWEAAGSWEAIEEAGF